MEPPSSIQQHVMNHRRLCPCSACHHAHSPRSSSAPSSLSRSTPRLLVAVGVWVERRDALAREQRTGSRTRLSGGDATRVDRGRTEPKWARECRLVRPHFTTTRSHSLSLVRRLSVPQRVGIPKRLQGQALESISPFSMIPAVIDPLTGAVNGILPKRLLQPGEVVEVRRRDDDDVPARSSHFTTLHHRYPARERLPTR